MTAATVPKSKSGSDRRWWQRNAEPPGRDNNAIIGQRKSTPYLFSLPAILLVAAILGFPVLYGVWQSLYRRPSLGLPAEWVGFENYADMFSSADFWHSLNRTTIFVFGSLILGTALGLFFAFALFRIVGKLRFLRAVTVALQSSSRVEGDIHHMSLAIEQGAEFDGRCRRPTNASELKIDLNAESHRN